MRKTIMAGALAAAFSLAFTAAPAGASNAIVSFTGGFQLSAFDTDETIGWVFTTDSALTVTALGWWTTDRGRTFADHRVSIWNDSGMLLGAVDIAAGPANDGVWRFVDVAPIALLAGGTYFIGGRDLFDDGDDYITSVDTLVLAPGLTFLGSAVSNSGAGFAFPGNIDFITTGGRFGPNFRFETAGGGVIPEPATWAMLIAGFGLVGSAMRRRNGRIAVSA